MLSLEWIQLRCPVCDTRFQSMTAAGAGADEHMAASAGRSGIPAGVLPYLVHVCQRCGYAGGVEDFAAGLRISAKVRVRVWRELAPTLAPSVRMPWLVLTAPGSEKYEGAAKVAEWRGADRLTVGDLWVRAARCALDERDHEAERYYARRAARWYARALECGDVAPQERAGMAYGLGELWVHIGDRQTAAGWFRRVNDEVIDPEVQRCLVEAAARQIGVRPTDGNT